MKHAEHVALLAPGVPERGGGEWADLGAGSGAFTLALADLIGPHGTIHAIDQDAGALAELRAAAVSAVPTAAINTRVADFTRPLGLSALDGVVMANSLHFIADKPAVLVLVRSYLRPRGRLLVVEYDADRGNPWVPFPFSFATWRALAADAGFSDTRQLASVPSRFLGRMYSALSLGP